MSRLLRLQLVLLCVACLGSCAMFSNAIDYRKTAEQFIESAVREDYDKCISLFALDRPEAQGVNLDTLKKGIATFRKVVVDELGTDIEYRFLLANKSYSSTSGKVPEDVTELHLEVSGSGKFDEVVAIFDDRSGKILNIRALGINKVIPSMMIFWLLGLLFLCVPAFNIYMIVRIKRSTRKRKWLKYLSLFIVNVPTISYQAITGSIFLNPTSFQVLLGTSFNYGSYSASNWAVGIPLAGLYWLWRLNTKPNLDVATAGKDSANDMSPEAPLDQLRTEEG
jgi:hypothetical protein